MFKNQSRMVLPGEFEPDNHWYPKALNATIHPLVSFFFHLKKEKIINRYCHLHPKVRPDVLRGVLDYKPKFFIWSGADLIHATTAEGNREMVVIETNSCPSGQKSMPLLHDNEEQGGYRTLMEKTFIPFLKSRKRKIREGEIAVIYDKNPMEASGYASALADLLDQPIHYVPFYLGDNNPPVKFEGGIMHVLNEKGKWQPIVASFRYLTQKPWNRLLLHSKTHIVNPIVACLAGGRNKMAASKAYELYNAEIAPFGLEILTPETIWDVNKAEIPLWVKKMGGHAVIKNPYSNAGQGVWTIVSQTELDAFMEIEHHYDHFIVQSLIGNYNWSSVSKRGKLFHVGTMPTEKGHTYVADIRMMVHATKEGIKPLAMYARRTPEPLIDHINEGSDSWAMLGTNLSYKTDSGEWGSDTTRLMMTDRRDFNKLGIGLDDIIDAYIQTVLSTIAIDKLAIMLYGGKNKFRWKLFQSLNNDKALLNEIISDDGGE